MNSSSFKPNRHLEYFRNGSNGLITFDNKHCNRNLRITEFMRSDIFVWRFEIGVMIFENRLNTGLIVFSATLIFVPSGIIGRGQNSFRCDAGDIWCDDDWREAAMIGASAINTAVAGIVLGTIKVP